MLAGPEWCPNEGDNQYNFDCQAAPCSCRNGRYKRAHAFVEIGSVQKQQCFTCVACAFSPRSNLFQAQDELNCAGHFGTFNSSQQCGSAIANNGTYLAVRYNSANGNCSGCVSSFTRSTSINYDRSYEFYTCNLPQGIRRKMCIALATALARFPPSGGMCG